MRKNEKERNDFWLELGPVDAFADMGCQAAWDGDASPDGKRSTNASSPAIPRQASSPPASSRS